MEIKTSNIQIILTPQEAISLRQLIGRGQMFYSNEKPPFGFDGAYKAFGCDKKLAKKWWDFAEKIMPALMDATEVLADDPPGYDDEA